MKNLNEEDVAHDGHYVVSEDIDVLVSRWCLDSDLVYPSQEFYLPLRKKQKDCLSNVFDEVSFLTSSELRAGLRNILQKHKKMI